MCYFQFLANETLMCVLAEDQDGNGKDLQLEKKKIQMIVGWWRSQLKVIDVTLTGRGTDFSIRGCAHFPTWISIAVILKVWSLVVGQQHQNHMETHLKCTFLGNGNPLQYSCLKNPMDEGAWWAAVHGVARSRTQLSDFTLFFHFYALEKEMATHSSILDWRITGMGEPDGLTSMGSHRVGHDWSDLAAAAAAAAAAAGSIWNLIN